MQENLLLRSAILEISKSESERTLDEIMAFVDIEKFVDTQVKQFSSGMDVRPALAVATHLEPGTLPVDKLLEVGDTNFQKIDSAK